MIKELLEPKNTITYLKYGYTTKHKINKNKDKRLLSIDKILERMKGKPCTK